MNAENPWKLTQKEQTILDAVIVYDGQTVAAQKLGLSKYHVNAVLGRARERMNARSNLAALLLWDRFVFGRGE